MVKRLKLFGAMSLLVTGTYGCQLTPKAASADTPVPHQQVAQAEVPAADHEIDGASDSNPPTLAKAPFQSPKTEMQKLAEENAQKAPADAKTPDGKTPAKRKKARNGEMPEYKRDYTEYLKKPATLGFHPREDEYSKILETIRNSFVESEAGKDSRLQAGLKKELVLFLDQAEAVQLQKDIETNFKGYADPGKEKLETELKKEIRLFEEHNDVAKLTTALNKDMAPVKNAKVQATYKKDLNAFVDRTKADTKLLSQLDGVSVDQSFSKAQQIFAGKQNKDLIGYVSMMGVLESLKDPYTVLMTPSEAGKLKEQLQSRSFGGIGIYIEIDREHQNQLTIFEPIDGTPASKAGLEAGDRIVKIDGKPTKGITIDVAQSKIRGEIGSTVNLTILRRDKTLEIPVQRGEIHVVSVTTKVYPGDIGYIRLRTFGSETGEELHAALMKMKEQKVKGIILDLRNNGGGYIDAAVKVVGEFAPPDTLVVYTINRDKHKQLYPSRNAGGVGVPVVCMINEFSASASEITAGALRDHKIATLVGDHSFGKGSVQQLFQLDQSFPPRGDDSPQLKLTIARFYAPGGDVIDKHGIEPQVVVDMEPRFVGKVDHDVQLKKALELLGGNITTQP